MKILFAYYSFEGNCRELASLMADAVGGEVEEVKPAKETVPSKGVMKYYAGGKGSLFREKPALKPLALDPRDYDLVFVGTPVWFWNMTPAARSFVESADWSGKKIALFSMHRGGEGMALSGMRKLITARGGTVVAAQSFTDLRWRKPDATRKAAVEWARAAVAKAGEGEA